MKSGTGAISGPSALRWRVGEVVRVLPETPRVSSLVISIPEWPGHFAGQHLDVRLTAEDGYQAQRSYSIASAPEDEQVAITVERLDDGEVSPYLVGEVRAGDKVELRGPIGGYFVWKADDPRPLLLVAGGSGVVPLMAMLRHRAARRATAPARLLFSSRAIGDVIYRDELERLAVSGSGLTVAHTLTRSQPEGWTGYSRRLDAGMVSDVAWPAADMPQAFICGPTNFVETAAGLLVDQGYDTGWIKTERFGAIGGQA